MPGILGHESVGEVVAAGDVDPRLAEAARDFGADAVFADSDDPDRVAALFKLAQACSAVAKLSIVRWRQGVSYLYCSGEKLRRGSMVPPA